MIITCKECNSSFNVDDGLIKETGSKVKCSKCENIFTAYPHSPEDDLLLNSDEQLLGSDESSELNDLDSSLDELFSGNESLDTPTDQEDADEVLGFGLGLDPEIDEKEDPPASAPDTEKSELDLGDLDDKLDMDPGAEVENLLEDTDDKLNLELDFDDGAVTESEETSMPGDELPDLEDLSTLDGESLAAVNTDAILEDLDLEAEDKQETTEKGTVIDDEPDLTGLDLEDAETAKSDDSDDLNLDQLLDEEDEIQENDEIADVAVAPEETVDKLDLSDLGLESDDAPAAETDTGEDSEDLNLDLLLDEDDKNQQDDKNADTDMALEEIDETLDLSDLDFEDDDAPTAETDTGEDSEDLNLDLLLDEDDKNQQDDKNADTDMALEEIDETLDLSDLDFEDDDAPVMEQKSKEEPEDFDLNLDSEPEAIADDADKIGDELDLSDLEEIIDSDSDEPAEKTADALEPELELNNVQETPAASVTPAAEDDDELDFSDLENMLKPDEATEAKDDGDNADELDLRFDIDEPVADVGHSPASGDSSDENGEDDLLDIEKMLEENEETADEKLDSPLEMEATHEDASKDEGDLELDFDLESELQEKEDLFEGSVTADEQLESNLLTSDEAGASEEAVLEGAELDEAVLQGAVTTDEFATDELLETGGVDNQTDVLPVTDDSPLAPAGMMPKSRSKKPVLVALLLLLLAGGILIVPNMLGIKIPYISDIKIPYLSDLDIKIPYLSDKLNPKAKDVAGNLKIIPLGGTINARFVNDSQGNQRFVIHGKIKNDYDHPRSFIKVTGKIYQKGGKLVKTESVYCGNVLSESELTGMKIAAITKRLSNRFGDKKSNLKVKTGQTLPFMIVFDKLPQNLDEYTVEVDGSSL